MQDGSGAPKDNNSIEFPPPPLQQQQQQPVPPQHIPHHPVPPQQPPPDLHHSFPAPPPGMTPPPQQQQQQLPPPDVHLHHPAPPLGMTPPPPHQQYHPTPHLPLGPDAFPPQPQHQHQHQHHPQPPPHHPPSGFGPPQMNFSPMFPYAPPMQMRPFGATQIVTADGWQQFVSPNGAPYYFNPITNQSSWTLPAPKQPVAEELRPTKWVKLAETGWMRVYTNTGQYYYHNSTTKASIWKLPEELSYLKDIPDSSEISPPPPDSGSNGNNGNKPPGEISTESETKLPEEDGKQNREGEGSDKESGEDDGTLSYAERVEIFKEMLRDKGVQPFSKWDKYLPKLHFDSRFSIIPDMKQRKAVFEHFVKHYAEEQRMQKKLNKASQKQGFIELISNPMPTPSDTYDTLKRRFGEDSRWSSVDTKLRKTWVEEVLAPIVKAHSQEIEKLRQSFREFLDQLKFPPTATWDEVYDSLSDDDRYLKLGSAAALEVFKIYQAVNLEGVAKERLREQELRKRRLEEEDQQREREEENRKREADKQAEVEKWASTKDNAATKVYSVLLREYCPSRTMTFEETVELFKSDARYSALLVSIDLQRQMFQAHCEMLHETAKDAFKALIREKEKEIALTASWDEIPESIKSDERFGGCDHSWAQTFFSELQEQRRKVVISEFKELLAELSKHSAPHKLSLSDVKDMYRNDNRYKGMVSYSRSERDKMIESYLQRAKDSHKSSSKSHHSKRHKHRR
eukprot:c16176_g1_i3.p1 GENE.c16176_g1_i3~~c16176_g1_i3.p1  ORF type:complete len:739 (+),score=146.19 c16176_g1_i3:22-2238(+)